MMLFDLLYLKPEYVMQFKSQALLKMRSQLLQMGISVITPVQ